MFPFKNKNKNSDVPRRRQVNAGEQRRERAAERESEQTYDFRRNRTMSGSLSSSVSSSAEGGAGGLQSPRTHVHHLTLKRRQLLSVFLVVVAVSSLLAFILFNFTVDPVADSSDHSISLNKTYYEKTIEDYLNKHPIERLRFALDEKKLNEYLQSTVPEVESVEQGSMASLGKSDFTLVMRQPVAGWVIGGKQYFVDKSGVPFEKNYYESPKVAVVDESGVRQESGAVVASSRFLAFVGRVVAEAESHGLVVEQAIIPRDTTRQLQVKLEGRAYPIKLSLDRSPAEQIEDAQQVVEYFDVKGQSPAYVDVRVLDKAYYR